MADLLFHKEKIQGLETKNRKLKTANLLFIFLHKNSKIICVSKFYLQILFSNL